MSARRLTDIHLVVLAGVLTVVAGLAGAVIAPPGAPGSETPSSFSAAGGGAKAAFLTLKASGYRIERSYEPMTAITANPAETMLLMTGTQPPSELDRRALENFLTRGGRVLLVGTQGADFLGVQGAAPSLPFVEPSRHRVVTPSALSVHASEITMSRVAGAPKFGSAYVAVFSDGIENPLVATARLGEGRVIWFAAATPLTNAHIADADNLQLLLNAAGDPADRALLWDEHYHGHSRSLWSYAARTPLPWVAAQLGVLLIFALAAHARRRGPVRARRTEPRTSPLEFIEMLGALYQRAGAASAAVAAARARLRRTIAAAHGIPSDSPDDAVAKAVATRSGVDAGEVIGVLSAADRATRDAGLKGAEALKLTRRLQQLTEAVARPAS
jgi:hypothetical protein